MKRVLTLALACFFTFLAYGQNDTLDYPFFDGQAATLFSAPGGGFVAGSNLFNTEIGQVFETTSGDLTSFVFWAGELDIIGTPNNFNINVYNVNTNGVPTGAPLASRVLSASDIVSGSAFADGVNSFLFNPPVAVSGKFAVAIDVDLSTKDDTLGLVTIEDNLNTGRSVGSFPGGGGWLKLENAWVDLSENVACWVTLENVVPGISINSKGNSWCSGDVDTVIAIFSGSAAPQNQLNVQWSPTTGVSNPFSLQTEIVVDASVPSYTVSVYDPVLNNTYTETINYSFNDLAVAINQSDPVQLPCGGSVDLSASIGGVTAGSSFTWSGPNNTSSSGTSFLDVDEPGTYTITGTNAFGCSAEDQIDVVLNSSQNLDFDIPSQICAGQQTTLTNTSDILTGWSFSWFVDGFFASSTQNLSETFPSGTYDITLEGNSGSCTLSTTKSITVQNCQTCNLTLPSTFTNVGSNSGTASFFVNESGGSSCSWNAFTNDPWITVLTSSGSGSGSVNFAYDACTGTGSRIGDITVSGQGGTFTYIVDQNCGGSNYCSGTTTLTNCSGSFNDGSGGSNYLNNTDCSWLIQPSGANSITLNFSSFNTESCCDYVEVYDGATTSAPSIGYFSGSSIPPSVTSSGGSMLVRFTTDASITESGWSANYSCNTGTSNCPGPATGQPFYRPDNNLVDCIVNGQFYSEQVEFEVPQSIGGTTVNSIQIDNISNIPCGINYTLDRPNGFYYGGEVACITFNGISNDPAGQYNLDTYIEIDLDGIVIYETLENFIDLVVGGNGSDFKLILRVKNTQGSNCPPVNTGSSGLTASANCNIPLGASPSASPETICIGGQSQLSANAYGGSGSSYTYSWSNPTTLSCSNCPSPIATPVNTTDYSVTVSDGVNSVVRTERVTITTSSPPCPPQQCTYVLDPDSTNISAAARTGLFFQVDVASGSNCSWTASLINNPGNMISLASASGNGSGIVTFDVADNLNSNPRVATILVGNQTHTVVQAANTSGCGLAQPTINRNNEPQLLASNHGNVEYAWYKSNDPTPVASGQFYTVTSNGCYKVRITEFGNPSCFNESNPACVNIDAIENIDGLNSLSIFPNPSTGSFYIEMESKESSEVQFRVLNTIGKTIYSTQKIEIQGKHTQRIALDQAAAGLYFVEIILNTEKLSRKLFIQY
ncbi:MAG: CUB domain-containing protein [Chitinophagales bacterium]